MKDRSQSGFAAVELVILVVLVAAIIATGVFVWHEHNRSSNTSTTTASSAYTSPPVSTPPAPQINNASDLKSALTALNQTSVSSSNVDSNQLSTYSSNF
jgi:Flp pilus assembly pilin Flp